MKHFTNLVLYQLNYKVFLCQLAFSVCFWPAFSQLPDEFQKVDLLQGLTNAVNFEFAPDGRIFIVDRYGELLIYKPNLQVSVSAGTIPVFKDQEDGLLGIEFDPNFLSNNYIYLHYSPLSSSVNRVSRFTMNGDLLDMASEVIILEWPWERNDCCDHAAGDLDFDSQGNLYIATGDNTDHTLYSPLDETDIINSAENTSSNTNDFRGKILRITPQADGSYTVPAGNLFPGGIGGLPEIYVMGIRNPYRMFVDKENTDWLFWADVGPDADNPGPEGPEGTDEINLTKNAGNYGWPYFSGKNEPFLNDYATPQFYYDPQAPVNISTWNTGATNLPVAQPSWVDFLHECYLAGPRYYFDPTQTSQQKLPIEFDEAFFYYDFNTSQVWVVKMDTDGTIVSNEQLAPAVFPSSKNGFIDMKVGPDGHLYILEYGDGCCPTDVDSGKLVRVDYTGQVSCTTTPFPDQWDEHLIDGALPYRSVYILPQQDIDGDGLKDIVTGGWWYKNPGTASGNWIQSTIGTPFNNVAWIYDFDGDGDQDLFGTQGAYESPDLVWAENDGTGNFAIHTNIPSGTTSYTEIFIAGIAGAIFQNGGPYQMAITWNGGEDGSSEVQMVTVPSDPVNGTWTIENIHPTSLGEGLTAGDIDDDGDLDLFQSGNWLRNEGGSWTLFTTGITYTSTFDRNALADFDKDGDLDGVAGQIGVNQEIAWLEAPDDPTQLWTKNQIDPSIDGSLSVGVADMDFDGDQDIIVGEWMGSHILFGFENDLCNSGTWIKHIIDPGGDGLDHHDGSQLVDIDNDGDLDIITIGWDQIIPRIFENLSGPIIVNLPPVLTSPADQIYSTGESINFQINGTDPNPGDVLTYSATGLPADLAIDGAGGLISGTLSAPVGDYTVTVRVTDQDGLFDEEIFTITVTDLSSLLRINSGGPSFTFGSEDWIADQYFSGGLTFSTTSAIAGTTNDELFQTERNANTGSMSYEIPVSEAGDYTVRLYFAEIYHTTTGSRLFDVDIENGEGQLTDYDIIVASGGPNTAVLETFNITVSDGGITIMFTNKVDRAKISGIEILSTSNVAPIVTNPGNQNYQDGTTVNLQIDATDPNPGDVLTYSATGLPADLSIDGASGLISGTLSAPVGDYTVTVQVTDQDGLFDEEIFTITVTDLSSLLRINSGGPSFTFGSEDWIADQYFAGGMTFSTTSAIAGTTNDALYQTERYADAGSMSYEVPLPAGDYQVRLHFAEIFHTSAGLRIFEVDIEGGQGQLTDYDIFVAAGGANTAVIETFMVTVADGGLTIDFTNKVESAKISGIEISGGGNVAPVVNNPGNQQYNTGGTVNLQLDGADPNPGDVLTYSATGLPADLSIDGASGLISGVLSAPAGDYSVTVRVEDQAGLFDEEVFTITLTNFANLLRINSGGPSYTFGSEDWIADQYFAGGMTFSTTSAIAGTTNDVLYQTERYADAGSMSYEVPLPPGDYQVRLHFAEIFYTSAGARVFDVNLENSQGLLSNYDIFIQAGGANIAVVETFILTVNDGGLSIAFASQVESAKISGIEINGVGNSAPVLTNPGTQVYTGGSNVNLQLDGSDLNTGDVLTYSATGLPAGLGINASTGLISGILSAPVGDYTVTVRLTDQDGLFDEEVFTISVTDLSSLLRINSGGPSFTFGSEDWIADQYFTGGLTYNTTSAISGTTNDALYQTERYADAGTMNYEIPLPPGDYQLRLHFAEIFLTSAGSRIFDVDIESGQHKLNNYDIFVASGGANTAVVETFMVTVTDGGLSIEFNSQIEYAKISGIEISGLQSENNPPQLELITAQTVAEGSTLEVLITAVDPDGDFAALSVDFLPNFASFTDNMNGTGTLFLAPGFADIGTYNVTVTATDNGGLTDSEKIIIQVVGENGPPDLVAIGDLAISEGEALNVALSASDPDDEIPILSIEGQPAFLTLTDNQNGTGNLLISPGFNDAGSYNVTVQAHDPTGLVDQETFLLTVIDANGPPLVTVLSNIIIEEGSSTEIQVSASDPDGEVPVISATDLPPFVVFSNNGNGTGSILIEPDFNEFGVYNFTIRATDATGLYDEKSVSLQVTEITDAPEWVVTGETSNANCLNENGTISLNVTGGFGAVSFEWSNGEQTMDITNLSSGVYTITITDQKNNESIESFTINLQPGPQKPTISRNEDMLRASEAFSYQWSFDGEELQGATAQTLEITLAGEYTVAIGDPLGCLANSDSIEIEFEISTINFYPNPSDGKLSMAMVLIEDEIVSFILIDDLGRDTPLGVFDLKAGRHNIELTLDGSLANGTYTILSNGKNFQTNVHRILLIR